MATITATKAKRPAKKKEASGGRNPQRKARYLVRSTGHFDEYPIRDKFRELFLKNSNVSSVGLVKGIEEMQYAYKKLLTKFCVGKKILETLDTPGNTQQLA